MAPKPQAYRTKNGDITWHVRYRIKGHPNPVKDTFEGPNAHADADRFAKLVERVGGATARATRVSSEASAAHVPTLATWLERHLDQVSAARTEGTVAEYAITRDACVAWVAWQRQQTTVRGKPYSAKSISNAARLLSSVMRSAVEAELIARNPAARLPIPSDQERHEMVLLTHNEYATLVQAIPAQWHAFVAFLAGTGCRFGEATALVAGDFDLDGDAPTVRISRAWKKGAAGVYLGAPKSRRGVRTITLGRIVVDAVRPLVEAGDGLVFTTTQGKRVQSQHFHTRVWSPALDRAGLGKRPRVHDLRHAHASWQIAAGIRPEVLQRRLGHESIKTTYDVYGHLLPDSHAGAAEAADRAMAGAFPEVEGGAFPQIEA